MDITRRAFARGLAALPAAAAISATAVPAAQARMADPLPVQPLARVKVGRFTVTVLNDGFYDMPYGFFTGIAPEEVEAAARAVHADREGALRLVFNQHLIDDGERLILVDSGPAGNIGEHTGRFPDGLKAIGVKPEGIDALVVTHTHFDHVSGAIAGGRKVFSDAEVYADRRDIAYFTDPAKRAAAPDFLRSSFDTAAEFARLYPGLQQIEGAHDISSGISTIDLTGHTPGHIGVRVADAGESLLIVADTLFHPVVHPVSADHGFVFEQDVEAARAMRAQFFPQAAEEGALIAATHMPFPGLGRIVRDNGKLRWWPAEVAG